MLCVFSWCCRQSLQELLRQWLCRESLTQMPHRLQVFPVSALWVSSRKSLLPFAAFFRRKRIAIDYTASGEIEYHKNKFRSNSSIYVDTGLFYNSRKNTDCGDFVVYDRKNKRLYFHATLRWYLLILSFSLQKWSGFQNFISQRNSEVSAAKCFIRRQACFIKMKPFQMKQLRYEAFSVLLQKWSIRSAKSWFSANSVVYYF